MLCVNIYKRLCLNADNIYGQTFRNPSVSTVLVSLLPPCLSPPSVSSMLLHVSLPTLLPPPLYVSSCNSHFKLCRCVCGDFCLLTFLLPSLGPIYKSNKGSISKKVYQQVTPTFMSAVNPKSVCKKHKSLFKSVVC